MRRTISTFALATLFLLLSGCAKQDQANYYTNVPDRAVANTDPYRWPPANTPNAGYCDEHGILTNWSTDYLGVEQVVDRHNDKYHKGNGSLHWATVIWKPAK
jgi:hypothetical protein